MRVATGVVPTNFPLRSSSARAFLLQLSCPRVDFSACSYGSCPDQFSPPFKLSKSISDAVELSTRRCQCVWLRELGSDWIVQEKTPESLYLVRRTSGGNQTVTAVVIVMKHPEFETEEDYFRYLHDLRWAIPDNDHPELTFYWSMKVPRMKTGCLSSERI